MLKKRRARPRRKPNWWRDGPPPTPKQLEESAKAWAGLPTGFEDATLDDFAWWLDRKVSTNPWVEAAFQFFLNRNDELMKALLRSDKPRELYEREAVKDYKRRRSPKAGRPRTPFYWLSARDHKLAMANGDVTSLMHVEKISESDAVRRIAEKRGIHRKLLQDWRDGRGGDVHRKRKSRKKAGI